MLKTHARYPCVCTHSTQSFSADLQTPKNLATILMDEGKRGDGGGCFGDWFAVCVWARRRGFMGARQLFFCDLRYRVAFGSIFALKFDLIRENYEANATFSANFCFYGCFC